MGSLDGRVALVTGGTAGIGRGIAEAFLAVGAEVAITGRDRARGARALAEAGAGAPERLAYFQSDAGASSAAAAAAVESCTDRFGRVDILVNNVGGASSQFAMVHELTDAGFDDGMRVNLYSTFWTTRAALPGMMERRWGRIINISSVQGKLANRPAVSPYVASKHAVGGLTKAVALEYGGFGITANAICPGSVATEASHAKVAAAAVAAGESFERYSERFLAATHTKRQVRVDEVAAVAVLLAADAGASMTGAQISVDGGASPW